MDIKMMRKRKKLTQSELASMIGVSQQAVARWEKGDSSPTSNKLPKLARALNCKIEELYGNV